MMYKKCYCRRIVSGKPSHLPLKGWETRWQLRPLSSLLHSCHLCWITRCSKVWGLTLTRLTPRTHVCRPLKRRQTDRSRSKHSETINHRTWAPARVPPVPLQRRCKTQCTQSQMGLNKLQLALQESKLKALLNKLWGLCWTKLASLQREHRAETRDHVYTVDVTAIRK